MSRYAERNGDSEETTKLLAHRSTETRNSRHAAFSCIPARYALAIMAFLGFFNVYCMRVNLSVALVAMVNSTQDKTNVSSSDECPDPNGGNDTSSNNLGEFDWDEETQSYILGAFFYGYIITQLPGGWLATKVGAKNLFGFGVMCTAIITIITPFAARTSVYVFLVVRVLVGLGEGVTFPAMHVMWSNWAPIWERSRLVACTYAGAHMGTVMALPISGILCDSDIGGGWPSVFYVFGSLGCLWFVLWMLLAHDTPASHPRITDEERSYIENSIGRKENVATPWISILTSPAVWACATVHFSSTWGFYTLLTCLPTYMKNILKFDLKENGLLSAIPYAACWFLQMSSGFLADYIRSNGYLSTKDTRKVFITLGLLLSAGLLLLVGYVGCDHVLAMVFLALSVGSDGLTMASYKVNHLDIAPRFAGVLMGITNSLATIPGFAGPAVVGILTNNKQTRHQWQIIFYITAGVNLFGAIVFILFGQGHELPWAKAPAREITGSDLESSVKAEIARES